MYMPISSAKWEGSPRRDMPRPAGCNQEKSASMKSKQHPKHEEIALRAFQLWTQEGTPLDNSERHWLQAEAELGNGANTRSNGADGRRAKRMAAQL
jgi:hypothetical protein